MTSFTQLHTINNEMFQFCFSKIIRVDAAKYYVAVKQNDQLVTAFEMRKHTYRNEWIICQPAPDWIKLQETALANMIVESASKKIRQKNKANKFIPLESKPRE